jgi:EAL domain-containing protein (putative c-di-GMP-specific phosphodiesterase class I)
VSRSVGLAHIIRQKDGTSTGVWGVYALKSAFQPIFAFREGGRLEIAAFEGLIRPFRNGEGVSPGAFFNGVPAADRLHVETLSRTLHLLNAGACLDPATSLFVNFDPSLFSEPVVAQNALREMRLVLHEAGIDASRIVCEVTEQRAAESALHMFVRALREHGFRIAVDDYGAEESGIQRINTLKPDIVKFDAHWITRLMSSGPGYALLEAMVAEFRSRGIVNLFEGIEETWQLELAEKCGVDMVQGYVLARPEIAPTSFGSFARPVTAAPADPAPGEAARSEPARGAARPAQQKIAAAAPKRAFGQRGRH